MNKLTTPALLISCTFLITACMATAPNTSSLPSSNSQSEQTTVETSPQPQTTIQTQAQTQLQSDENQSELQNSTLTQETTEEQDGDQKITYINKGTPNQAVLSADSAVIQNNYFKYKDINITFIPKTSDKSAGSTQLYDIVMEQNGNKQVLVPDLSVSGDGYIRGLQATKLPYIIDNPTGFGDGGLFDTLDTFINILNQKSISIESTNEDISLPNDSGLNETFTVEKNRFSLASKKLYDQCEANKDYQKNGMPITDLLMNDQPVLKLSKPTLLFCQPNDMASVTGASFDLAGMDKDFQKVQFTLSYGDQNPINSDENSNNASTNDISVVYELDLANGTVTQLYSENWKQNNILGDNWGQ